MPFRKKNHIKWSMLELRGLLEDEDSRVHYQRVKKHLALYPFQLNDLNKTLREILDAKLNFCDPELQGVVLAYRNPKLLDSVGFIDADSYFIHMDMEADFYIFKPEIGCVLSGIVNKKADNHVGILVHKVFNISIPKPDESEEWHGDRIILGQRVKFTVTRLDFKGKLLFIRGELTLDKAWLESFCNEGRNRIQVKKLETLMAKKEETELVKDDEPFDTLAELPRQLSPPEFTPVNYYRFSLNFSDSHSRIHELNDVKPSNEEREIEREKGESPRKPGSPKFTRAKYYHFSNTDSSTQDLNDVKRSNEKKEIHQENHERREIHQENHERREIHQENHERREIHQEKGESPRKPGSPKYTPTRYRFSYLDSSTQVLNHVEATNEKRDIHEENHERREIRQEKGESLRKPGSPKYTPARYYRFSNLDSSSQELNDVKRSNDKKEIHQENHERREIHQEKRESPRKPGSPKFTPTRYYRFSNLDSSNQVLNNVEATNEKGKIHQENHERREIHQEKGESPGKPGSPKYPTARYYRFSNLDSSTKVLNDIKRSNEKKEIHQENHETREIHQEKGESPRKPGSPKYTPGRYYRFSNLDPSTQVLNVVERTNEKIPYMESSSDETTCLRKVTPSEKKESKASRKMEKRIETDESDNLGEREIQESSKVPKSNTEKSAKKKRKIADSELVTTGVNDTQQQYEDSESVVNEVSSSKREKSEKNKRKRAPNESVSKNLDDTEQSGNIVRSVSNKELNEDVESRIEKKSKILESPSKCEELEKKRRKRANNELLPKDLVNMEQQSEIERSVTNGDLDEDVKPWIENKPIIVESPLQRDKSEKKRRKRANSKSLWQNSVNMEQQGEIGRSVTNGDLDEDVKPWIENKPIIVESSLKRDKSEKKRRKRANSESLSQDSENMEQQGEIGRSVTNGDLDEDVKPWIEYKPIIVEFPLKCDKSEKKRRRREESTTISNNHEDTDLDESSTKRKRKNRTAGSDSEAASEIDIKPDVIVERKKKKRGKTGGAVVEETITIEEQDDEVKDEEKEEKKKLRKKITENNNIESATIQDNLPDIKPFEFIKPDPDMIVPSPKSKKKRRKNVDETETAMNVTENNQDTKINGFFSDVRVKVEPDPSDCESSQTPSKKDKKKRKKRSTGDLLVNNDIETFGDVKVKKEEIVSDVEDVAGKLSKKKKKRKKRDPDTFTVVKVKDEPNESDVEDTKNFKVKVENEILYTFEC